MDRLTEINKQIEALEKERSRMTSDQFETGRKVPNAVEYDGPRATRGQIRCTTDRERIHNLFIYHQPEQHHFPKFEAINQAFENAALVALSNVSGVDRDTVIEGLSQLRMVANRGIIMEGR